MDRNHPRPLHSCCGLALASVLALSCGRGAPGSTATPELPAQPTVLVVVLDGARDEETLGNGPSSATGEAPWAMMPTVWDELVPQGVRATAAWTLSSSTTVPSHAAMITGRRAPPVANYPPGDGPGAYLPSLPVLAQALLKTEPALDPKATTTIANTELLEVLTGSLWPGAAGLGQDAYRHVESAEGGPSHDDTDVLDALVEAMDAGGLRLALANLHQVDRSGHNGDQDAYPDDIRALDRPLTELWRAVQDHPDYADRTYLLILSDHGRHSAAGSDPPWRHHGCSCSGCRRLPFLMLGPGVRAGEALHSPVLLVDVAPTLGALLGVDLPWADGLVRDDLLLAPTGWPSRAGIAATAAAGAHRAELRYRDDPAHRAALWVDGQRLSDPDSLVVEAPSLANDGEGAWACWRALQASTSDTQVSWAHRCAVSEDGGVSWDALAFAEDQAGPYGRVQLEPWGDGLLAAWVQSPNGSADGGGTDPDEEGTTVSLRVALHDGGAWQGSSAPSVPSFPTDLALAVQGATLHLAMGAADPDAADQVRHTRRIWLAQATQGADGWSWTGPTEVDLDGLAPADAAWRVEQPALTLDGQDRLLLAASGYGSEGSSQAIVALSDDGGASFTERAVLQLPGPLQPTTGPVWLTEHAVFSVIVDDAVQLCAGGLEGEVTCIDTGAPRVLQLEASGDTLHAIVDVDQGHWEKRQWKASSFGAR